MSARLQDVILLGVSALTLIVFGSLPSINYWILFAVAIVLMFLPWKGLAEALGVIFFAAVLVFFVWTENANQAWLEPRPQSPYGILAVQIEQGHWDMPGDPDPALASLKNPYDPVERNQSRIPFSWDHSYYKGRYYLYWGITPILTLLIPFHALTGKFLSDPAQVTIFGLLAYVFAYLLAIRWIQRGIGKRPDVLSCFLIAGATALCTEMASTMRQAAVYQVAILASLAFSFIGFYFLSASEKFKSHCLWGGFFLALAVGARPSAIVGFFAIPFLLKTSRSYLQAVLAMLPVALAVAAYNYVRFDNPFEFGLTYQLGVADMTHFDFSWKNQLYTFGAFLFQPAIEIPEFPFVQLRIFGYGWLAYRHPHSLESVIGLLRLAPFLLMLIPALPRIRGSGRGSLLLSFVASGLAAIAMTALAGICRRYSAGAFPYFLIAGLAGIFMADHLKRSPYWRGLAILGILYSINLGFFASASPEFSKFKQDRPEFYQKMAAFYK